MLKENKSIANQKIRIGLILDSQEVYAWIFLALERLYQSESASIVMVIMNNASSVSINDIPPKNQKIPFLFKIFDLMDKKLFIREKYAFSLKSLNKSLEQIEKVSFVSDFTGKGNSVEVIQQIRSAKLDLLIDFSTTPITSDILLSPRMGTWSYRFGDNGLISDPFYGYWEVIRKNPKTMAKIISISKQNGMNKVICQSHIATYKLSPNRNRNSISWFAASFLVRLVEFLYKYGEDKFYERFRQNKHSIKTEIEDQIKIKRSYMTIPEKS